MAEVMDLDMSLDDIAKKRAAHDGKRGRGRGRATASGRVASSLKRVPARASPYVSRVPSSGQGICSHLSNFLAVRSTSFGSCRSQCPRRFLPSNIVFTFKYFTLTNL